MSGMPGLESVFLNLARRSAGGFLEDPGRFFVELLGPAQVTELLDDRKSGLLAFLVTRVHQRHTVIRVTRSTGIAGRTWGQAAPW